MGSAQRYKFYERIYRNTSEIYSEAKKLDKEIGLSKVKGKVGLCAGFSSCPGPLPKYVLDAIIEANRVPVYPASKINGQIRDLIKDLFGDDYDVAVTNSCESALRVSMEALFAPPIMRRGDAYRARYITPYGEDFDFFGAYGRAFPPRYKNLVTDRSASAGELGMEAKVLPNLDCVMTRLDGAKYEAHGIRYNICSLLLETNVDRSFEVVRAVAERHASELVGFATEGYDTPGFGQTEKDSEGRPKLSRLFAKLAKEYGVPHIVDAACGLPVLGLSPEAIGADVMMWSMDKEARSTSGGLMIGKEESMIPIRKGLGLSGHRYGEPNSYSKGAYSFADPGRVSLIGIAETLKVLKERPGLLKKPMDRLHKIVEEEYRSISPARLRDGLRITKSYTLGGTEVNYQATWNEQEAGIPIFSYEDMFSHSNLITDPLDEVLGIYPPTIYNANVFLSPGLGTVDEEGNLMEEETRLAVRALVRMTEVVCRAAGIKD